MVMKHGFRAKIEKVIKKKEYPTSDEYLRKCGKSNNKRCQFGEEMKEWCKEKYVKFDGVHRMWFCKEHWELWCEEPWKKSKIGEVHEKSIKAKS